MTDPEDVYPLDWLSFDIIEFGLSKQAAYANGRWIYREANGLPNTPEPLRIEEKPE